MNTTSFRVHRNVIAMIQVARLRSRGYRQEADDLVFALANWNKVEDKKTGDLFEQRTLAGCLKTAIETIRTHDALRASSLE